MPRANSWHGDFPWRARRGYSSTAPVGSYPANGYGPYGMAGNVWEWTSGWYQQHDAGDGCCAPIDPPVYPRGGGRDGSLDPRRYRPAARRPQMVDTGMSHIGCRCAAPLAEGGSHELAWPDGMAPFKVVDDGSQGDPYAHYEWMRENAPVLRAASPVSDVWFISRYDDVRKAMRAPKVFSSQVVDPVPPTFLALFDAPNHTRLRQVVAQAFIPKAIARFEERVRENATKYLAPMIAAGGGDAVDDYAIPLSMSTISALLDVPAEDFEKMKFWSDETFSYFGRLARNAQGTGTDEQSTMEFFAYLKDTMERLHREESDSVGRHIARMWKDGLLSEKEAKELCAFVFVAGQECGSRLSCQLDFSQELDGATVTLAPEE